MFCGIPVKSKASGTRINFMKACANLFAGISIVLLFPHLGQAQNLFVADWYGFHVYEYTPDGAQSTFASALGGPVALTFSSAGDLYVGSVDGGGITKIAPGGAKTPFASQAATSLAFDSTGNLFVSDYAGGNIYEYTPGGIQSTFVSGLQAPYGIAFDSVGNLFVANSYGETVIRITPGGVQSTFATGLSTEGLAFDSAGNLFAADFGSGNIYEFTPDGIRTTFASGLIHPFGLAFNNAGDLFVSDNGDGSIDSGKIYEFTTSGDGSLFASGLGYGIPSGLAFQPVPEPSVWAIMGMGVFATVVFWACKHNKRVSMFPVPR